MPDKIKTSFYTSIFTLLIGAALFSSCQKEIDFTTAIAGGAPTTPVKKKPKVGTQWNYIYTRYYSFAGVFSTKRVGHRAISEETYGGEKWLNVIDTSTGATVYLLNEKSGALYQYANNSSNLFFKYPAAINDTYTTYNSGMIQDFLVKDTGALLLTGLGDITVNYYRADSSGIIKEELWYNEYAWIARQYGWFKPIYIPAFRLTTLFLQTIDY